MPAPPSCKQATAQERAASRLKPGRGPGGTDAGDAGGGGDYQALAVSDCIVGECGEDEDECL